MRQTELFIVGIKYLCRLAKQASKSEFGREVGIHQSINQRKALSCFKVLGSDIIYSEEAVQHLIQTVVQLYGHQTTIFLSGRTTEWFTALQGIEPNPNLSHDKNKLSPIELHIPW
ncbi:hypothetical protein F2Q70_00030760 [Brassica cretica]|uniref:Uncharacterized protein n=1 Tax=Brassica cretica TaxID=69181 RepID=A0A8S9GYV2_BRACR|nr:hypothetical protein F2Q70_00030760 [Brassica cretica]KAF2549894.1 hypothetical protein F2Q68_00035148 [Brassica cretica]